MTVFQIKVIFKPSVARAPRFFYLTSKRDALQAARKEFRPEGRYPPIAVQVRKITFKDVPPKKLLMAVLNATEEGLDLLSVVESTSIVEVLLP